jgi:Flp pilus assembly pilin Flp
MQRAEKPGWSGLATTIGTAFTSVGTKLTTYTN